MGIVKEILTSAHKTPFCKNNLNKSFHFNATRPRLIFWDRLQVYQNVTVGRKRVSPGRITRPIWGCRWTHLHMSRRGTMCVELIINSMDSVSFKRCPTILYNWKMRFCLCLYMDSFVLKTYTYIVCLVKTWCDKLTFEI